MDIKEALATLDLAPNCTVEDLKSAYRKRARETHPDRAGAESAAVFIRVKKAYDVLLEKGTGVHVVSLTHHSIFNIVKN